MAYSSNGSIKLRWTGIHLYQIIATYVENCGKMQLSVIYIITVYSLVHLSFLNLYSNLIGLIWAMQPNGDIYTYAASQDKCSMVQCPSYRRNVLCLSSCRDAVWVLTEDNEIFIRSGIRPNNPQGVDWCKLDLSQLGMLVLRVFIEKIHPVWK